MVAFTNTAEQTVLDVIYVEWHCYTDKTEARHSSGLLFYNHVVIRVGHQSPAWHSTAISTRYYFILHMTLTFTWFNWQNRSSRSSLSYAKLNSSIGVQCQVATHPDSTKGLSALPAAATTNTIYRSNKMLRRSLLMSVLAIVLSLSVINVWTILGYPMNGRPIPLATG